MSCNCDLSDMVTVVDIEMFAGNTRTIVLDLRSGDEQFELPGNGRIQFSAKYSRHDTEAVVSVTVDSTSRNSEGEYEIPLDVDDTADLDEGQYKYDIGVQWEDNFVTVVEGTLRVRSSISKVEEVTDG